jgi:aspartyl-tRNA(Asn)/glutamyl-tRNA(Gln) amidotransferase subunit A
LRGLRIGLMLEAGCGLEVEPETEAAVVAAAQAFSDAGVEVEPIKPFLTRDMLDGLDRFWRARFLDQLVRMAPEQQERVLPYIREWVEEARGYDGLTVFRGSEQVFAMCEQGRDTCAGYDFVLSPVSPVPAFGAEMASPLDDPARPFEHIAFTVAWNMTGQPAASINCGYTASGLPIGLQIIGRRFDDLGVLQMSHAYEQMRPTQRPWPRPWSMQTPA